MTVRGRCAAPVGRGMAWRGYTGSAEVAVGTSGRTSQKLERGPGSMVCGMVCIDCEPSIIIRRRRKPAHTQAQARAHAHKGQPRLLQVHIHSLGALCKLRRYTRPAVMQQRRIPTNPSTQPKTWGCRRHTGTCVGDRSSAGDRFSSTAALQMSSCRATNMICELDCHDSN
jgi:hypothetical protein